MHLLLDAAMLSVVTLRWQFTGVLLYCSHYLRQLFIGVVLQNKWKAFALVKWWANIKSHKYKSYTVYILIIRKIKTTIAIENFSTICNIFDAFDHQHISQKTGSKRNKYQHLNLTSHFNLFFPHFLQHLWNFWPTTHLWGNWK